MKNHYDFDGQIKALNNIFSTNVSFAQKANQHLKKMCPSMVYNIVKQLRSQYEQNLKDPDQEDKLNSIKSTLNMIARENITNIDFLFIELAQQINDYYNKEYFVIKKQIPYLLKCSICLEDIANDKIGFHLHHQKCDKLRKKNQTSAPQKKSKKKTVDNIQFYKSRQILVDQTLKDQQKALISQNFMKSQIASKVKQLKNKKQYKLHKKQKDQFTKMFERSFKRHAKEGIDKSLQIQGLQLSQSDEKMEQKIKDLSQKESFQAKQKTNECEYPRLVQFTFEQIHKPQNQQIYYDSDGSDNDFLS